MDGLFDEWLLELLPKEFTTDIHFVTAQFDSSNKIFNRKSRSLGHQKGRDRG